MFNSIIKKHWKLGSAIIAALAMQGCANTTSTGAIGIERNQLMLVSTDLMHNHAANNFNAINIAASKKNILNTDKALTKRVTKIAFSVIGHVGVFREDAYSWDWEISIYDDPQINAFCAPGGKIGIFTGMLKTLKLTDDEIAAVIGHEVAHALREHSREKMSQQAVSALVSTSIGVATGVSPQLLEKGSSLLVHLPNSRSMELEADVIGLELMARAGYDPRKASSLWRKIQVQQNGKAPNVLLSTHPASSERIALLDANVSKVIGFYENHPARRR